jgi:hypothetical protein
VTISPVSERKALIRISVRHCPPALLRAEQLSSLEHDMEHDMEHRGGRYNTLARGAPGEKEREREVA